MNLLKRDEVEILRYMGMPRESADNELIQQVHKLHGELETYIESRTIYRYFTCKVIQSMENMQTIQNRVQIVDTSLTIESKDLTKLLKDATGCYIMAATLGPRVDDYIRRLQKVDMLEALIVNACATMRIEKLCDEVETQIMAEIEEGQYLTMRYSPGYGDVAVTLQKDILELLDASRRIGLMTTKASMLIPSKSVTALIGITNEKQNRMKSCHTCHLKETCTYRKRGDRCGTT